MIQIIFPQLDNHNYKIPNPNHEKTMRFYLSEALMNYKDSAFNDSTNSDAIAENVNFTLMINGQQKELDQSLSQLYVNKASKIQIFLYLKVQLAITFQKQNDKIIHEFNCYDKVLQLEKKLKQIHNLPYYDLEFFHKNNLLNKEESFMQQSIQSDSEIYCQIIGTYQINYKGENLIKINILSTVSQVYKDIQDYYNFEKEFDIYYQNELLIKNKLNRDLIFQEYKIKPHSELRLKFHENITIKLYIEFHKIQKYYKVSQQIKFRELKNQLIEEFQINKQCQYSFFVQNQQISDDNLISQWWPNYKEDTFILKVMEENITFYICERNVNLFKVRVCMNKNQKIQDLSNLKQFIGVKHRFYYQNLILNMDQSFNQINLNNQDIIEYEIDYVQENINNDDLIMNQELLIYNEVINLKFAKTNSDLVCCEKFSIYSTFDQIKEIVGKMLEIQDISKMIITYNNKQVLMNLKIIELRYKPQDILIVEEQIQQYDQKLVQRIASNS